MKTVIRTLAAAASAALALAAAAQAQPPSAEAFTRNPAIASVSLSPDGRYLAAVTAVNGGNRFLNIWRTDALNETPVAIGSHERLDVIGAGFLNNDRLVVTMLQPLDFGAIRTYVAQSFIVDLEGNQQPILRVERGQTTASGRILNRLAHDNDHILAVDTRSGDIYRVNIYSGRQDRIQRASERFSNYQADLQGELRARQEVAYDSGNVYFAQWLRHPDTGSWEEHFRWYLRDREPLDVLGFTRDPNIVFVATNQGRDNAAIFEYNIRDRQMLDIAFEHPFFDAVAIIQSSAAGTDGELLGFRYAAPYPETVWVHPRMASIQAGLEQALGIQYQEVEWTGIAAGTQAIIETPVDAQLIITSFTHDMTAVVFMVSGPSTPPAYYLYRDGQPLRALGRAYPEIDRDALGRTRVVQYRARDGLMIPAFLTEPPRHVYGDGPWPAIVLPHGGPWARDDLEWDDSGWTQYFAARGYVVMQPQFRGSEGWGQRLWRAGDGEWGGAMQDDKDDGALWMVEQGIADPARIVMHGFSYGGYAAMVAAIRPNGIYRCAIAGAGVSSIERWQRGIYGNRLAREFQRPTVEGLSPIARAAEASIPIFLYHGDRDQIVLIEESTRFESALRRAGRNVTFLRIDDMPHGYASPQQGATVLTAIEGFLNDGCGLN
ncbi:MAG: S9 family peptidase [Maricaulaceae bacterium]|nr:S9 family peptidase [Maricaulaceae bacterium]